MRYGEAIEKFQNKKKNLTQRQKAKLFGGVQGCSRILNTLASSPTSASFLSTCPSPTAVLTCLAAVVAVAEAASPVSAVLSDEGGHCCCCCFCYSCCCCCSCCYIFGCVCLVLGSGATDATDAKVKSSKLNFFFFLFLLWLSLSHRLRDGAQGGGGPGNGNWSLVTGIGFPRTRLRAFVFIFCGQFVLFCVQHFLQFLPPLSLLSFHFHFCFILRHA